MNIPALRKEIFSRLEAGLPPALSYHGVHHTREVLSVALELATLSGGLNASDLAILEASALLHDAGFLEAYRNHEEESCLLAQGLLPAFGFGIKEISRVCQLIMATKIPQAPLDSLAELLCDADLDYLGREDYYPIAGTLYSELRFHQVLSTEKQWVEMQVRFLEQHHYWTPINQERREPGKQERLAELKNKLKTL